MADPTNGAEATKRGQFIGGPVIYVSEALLMQRGEAQVRQLVRELLNAPRRPRKENSHG